MKVHNHRHPFINWLRTNPILKTAVAAIPMTWHGIMIGFYGKQSGFLDVNGDITSKGKTVTIAVYSFVILYTFAINVFDRMRIKHEAYYASIAKFVLDETLFLYSEKLDNQKKTFFCVDSQKKPNASFSYNVLDRINSVLVELIRCVEDSSGLKFNNISAALFYSFDNDDEKWQMVQKNYCDAYDGKIRDVIMSPDSFARFLNEKYDGDFYILWDKRKDGENYKDKDSGNKIKIYKENRKDVDTGRCGSVVGWKFKIEQEGTTYINAMLFISTYGGKLDKSFMGGTKSAVKQSLTELILPYFQMNLQAELMHLYKEHKNAPLT